jgi:alpha-tubulin suppressor-like RCC1 family protein
MRKENNRNTQSRLIGMHWRSVNYFGIAALIFLTSVMTCCGKGINIKPMISVGGRHTCLLTSDGSVKCWGNNYHGELGDDSSIEESLLPVDVIGLNDDVTFIASGGFHNCAIFRKGVQCWGNNESGQLGDNTYVDRNMPVSVVGLSDDIIALAAGESFTCALSQVGNVSCWGDNHVGQLGDGTKNSRNYPESVQGLYGNAVEIAADNFHVCVLLTSGSVECWGQDIQNPMGDPILIPKPMSGLTGHITAIAAGGLSTCAMLDSGIVKCWGEMNLMRNTLCQPIEVMGLPKGIIAIDGGDVAYCALTSMGGVSCWGDNELGQLGDGSSISTDRPVDVIGMNTGVVSISAGGAHTCALLSSNRVKCWGWNVVGQLGDGTAQDQDVPVDVIGLDLP